MSEASWAAKAVTSRERAVVGCAVGLRSAVERQERQERHGLEFRPLA